MAKTKITSALLIATAAFISVPASAQTTATPGRLGVRAAEKVGGRVMKPNNSVRSTPQNKVDTRIKKPSLQHHKLRSDTIGKRYLKGNTPAEKVGARAYKLKP